MLFLKHFHVQMVKEGLRSSVEIRVGSIPTSPIILLKQMMMCTRQLNIKSYTLDTVRGIAKKCDWVLDGKNLLKKKDSPQSIFLDMGAEWNNKGKFAIEVLYTYLLKNLLDSKFILICAGGDYSFPLGIADKRYNMFKDVQKEIAFILQHPLLKHAYVENLDQKHDKMSPILLSFLSDDLHIKDVKPIDHSVKSILCYCRQRTRLNSDGEKLQFNNRKIVDDLCKNEWKNFVTFEDEEISCDEFNLNLKKSKFCLCVNGGGIDPCPKLALSILNGCIPIVCKSGFPLDELLMTYPIIMIDKWTPEALSAQFLASKYEELKRFYENVPMALDKLTMDFFISPNEF